MPKELPKILLFTLLLSFSTFTYAQQKETSIGFFASLPVGDFGSTDLDNNGGFTQPGWGIAFDSKLRAEAWPENFSLNLHSSYQWNKIDNDALAAAYTDVLGFETTVSESRHSPIVLTVGPKYDFPIGEKIHLGITGGIGVMFTNTKAFTIKGYDNAGTVIFREVVTFDNNPAFTYVLGADLKFDLVEDLLSLAVYADFNAANQGSEISFTNTDGIQSTEEMRYLNTGIKIILYTSN